MCWLQTDILGRKEKVRLQSVIPREEFTDLTYSHVAHALMT